MAGDWHKVHGEPALSFDIPAKTPLVDLLRRVPMDAYAVSHGDGSGTSYGGVGKIMHEAADVIEKLQTELMQPSNTVDTPSIQHILSRDQRDALCAANAWLASMQNGTEGVCRQRLQKVMNVISEMLYGE